MSSASARQQMQRMTAADGHPRLLRPVTRPRPQVSLSSPIAPCCCVPLTDCQQYQGVNVYLHSYHLSMLKEYLVAILRKNLVYWIHLRSGL